MSDELDDPAFIGAEEAARLLDVKRATLYAYVSRGQIRSVAGERGRARRYARSDVERLRARHDARRGHRAVAAGALRWGEPVLDSAVTEIDVSGHRYRGHDALALARERSFEEVAELLWTGQLAAAGTGVRWDEAADRQALRQVVRVVPDGSSPLATFAVLVPLMAVGDADRHLGRHLDRHLGRQPGADSSAELARARRIALTMATATDVDPGARRTSSSSASAGSVAARLDAGLRARGASGSAREGEARRRRPVAPGVRSTRRPRCVQAIDRALVLVADHELNASAFAARVAASAGADLYACVSAGLAALSGPLHGGMCDRVEALVRECGRPERAAQVIRDRARRGEAVPGFGHRLYTDGDPRGRELYACARALGERSRELAVVVALTEAMARAGREPPTLDIGLVALCAALGLRAGSASALFAVGRTAGWIAHALEQREAGFVLRPRARFADRR